MTILPMLPAYAQPENLPHYPKADLQYLEIAPVPFLPVDLAFIVGAVQERSNAAAHAGVSYGMSDFIREALIEAAHR